MSQDSNWPKVENKTNPPPGVMPRRAQAWILGGVAVAMILVLTLTGNPNPPKRQPPSEPPAPVPANDVRIREYRERIEVQSRKLLQEQADLVRAKQIAAQAEAPYATTLPLPQSNNSVRPSYGGYATPREESVSPERRWIDTEREKRNYQSLFASSVALTYRPQQSTSTQAKDTLQRDEMATALDGIATPTAGEPPYVGGRDATFPERKGNHDTHEAINTQVGKFYRLFEGTLLETVLQNRLDGAFSGPVHCMVTTAVYSLNRQRVLIPQGARVLGEVKAVEAFGQRRLVVTFHRLIMPDGYTVNLNQFRGLNQIGETGLRDRVNNHYMQLFGVSIAIGAIGGFSQGNSRAGIDSTGLDVYRQGVASSLSQSSLRILDRYLSVLPTLTIREGQRVKIYLADDLLLPAYDNHRMPGDL